MKSLFTSNLLLGSCLFLLTGCNQTHSEISESRDISQPITTQTQDTTRPPRGAMGGGMGGGMGDQGIGELAPYQGIFTENGAIEGLFSIAPTGVSTLGIQSAAEDFISSLNTEQKSSTLFEIDDEEWRRWSNVDTGTFTRAGISLRDMQPEQKKLAFDLMEASLSLKGYNLSRDIMKTDTTTGELTGQNDRFSEELYYFTFMGTPSQTEPWGWQLDGHHLAINLFVLGDQIVMTPTFLGGEPVTATSGIHEGNVIMQDEQNMALAFMQSLNAEQQSKATMSAQSTGRNMQVEAFSDNKTLAYQGINTEDLAPAQQAALLDLIGQYVNNMKSGHAQIKMSEVKAHLNETWFSWVGGTADDAVFYYRIHSPVVLIEFDHQGAVALRTGDRSASRNHIHAVVRTPNGNDYGQDLLKQHLEHSHND